MTEEQQWLVCFDTDRIKQYLLATNRLKEIRGGSALIAELDNERKEHLAKRYEVVYSAGGGAAVLVPTEQEAKKLIAEIENEFRAQTFTASITGVSLSPDATQGRSFGARMTQGSRQLHRAKAAKAELSILPVEPYMRLCSSCGQNPAAHSTHDGSGDWLCRACHKKRALGGKDRKGFFSKFARWADPTIWTEETLADDLDAIGAISSPPGYIGFIALDGNHIGSLLDKPATVEAYRSFSEGLYDLTQKQTFTALKCYGRPCGKVAPFEIVLIGGDDVLLITAADIAIEIALAIARGYEEQSQEHVLAKSELPGERKKLTMACGVVLAHADFPIPAMHTLAESLQKSAKKLCAAQEYQTGAIDFQVVSGSDSDLDEMRRLIPHRRPYTLDEMKQLLKYIRDFRVEGFPTSQLQGMYQALFESEVNAQLASIATLGRLGQRNEKQYELLRGFFSHFGVEFDGQLPPWDANKRSALADLVELYPFIQTQKERRDGKGVH
jgi:CRISPR/Cas system-associated protein Cas10 (large subunit of type III CRISPR-Cas system)